MSKLPPRTLTLFPPSREQVVAIMELLATRMSWSTAKLILANAGIYVSRGWSETIANARKALYSDSVWENAYNTLSGAAKWHTYVGNKHVSFFDLRAQNELIKKNVINWTLRSAVNDLKPVLMRRPFDILSAPTQQDELETFKNNEPKLIAAELQNGRLYLQFFSTRAYSHRESLDIAKMTAAQAIFFAGYEEVIGVKTRWVPCFDTIVVDTTNDLVEFRIDFAPGLNGVSKNFSAFACIMSEFNRLAAKFIAKDMVALGAGLVNLHPAINPMYKDSSCGRVTALGFVATGKDSSSNNYGQIQRSNTQDFRKDTFHVGGKKNVEKVDPYAIGVTWSGTPPKSDLYLELKGSIRNIYSGKLPAVTTAEFLGCVDGIDYDFVANELLIRLPRKKK